MSIFLILALVSQQTMSDARVIAGETPGCPLASKVAAAWVMNNRREAGIEDGWTGDADPTDADLLAAAWWSVFPDPTGGALYYIGPGDREKMPWLRFRTGRWKCPNTWNESWM